MIVSVCLGMCEALHLCHEIPDCKYAGLAAANCALVIVEEQLQTHKHEPRPLIKGDGGRQPGVSLRLQPRDMAEKWVFIPYYWCWPPSLTSAPFHSRVLGYVNEALDVGIFMCFS